MFSSLSTASFLDNSNPLLCTGACIAIGEIGRNGPLPIEDGVLSQDTSDGDKGGGEEESSVAKKGRVEKQEIWTKALVVEKLVAKLESSKVSTKVIKICSAKLYHFCNLCK